MISVIAIMSEKKNVFFRNNTLSSNRISFFWYRKNQSNAQHIWKMKLVMRRWMTVAGTNVNFESSVGAKRKRMLLRIKRIEIKMMINLYHKSSLAFFILNNSPSLELLISRSSLSESIPKAVKRRIKLKDIKVRISVYSYIKRDSSFLWNTFYN